MKNKKANHLDYSNICFVNTCKSWGGGEKWHYSTALAFSKNYNVSLITNNNSELYNKIKDSLPTVAFNITNLSFLNPFKIFKLFSYFKENNIHSVVLNLPSDVKTAGIAARLAGIKKITYRRGMPNPIKNTLLNRFLFKHVVSDVIANSVEIKRSITSRNKKMFPLEKINVVYNSVNFSLFSPVEIKEKGIVRLGCAGRLVTQKNQNALIPMIKNLIKAGFNVQLFIAGKGELETSLKTLIEEHGLRDYIKLVGFIDDIQCFLDDVDIFLFPSLYEGSANILVEVMAKGVPIVTFDRSSMPEMIIDHKTGLLASSDKAFENAIVELLNSSELRANLGRGARNFVDKNLNSVNIYKQIEKVIV